MKLKIDDLEELIEISEVMYKKTFETEDKFKNIINEIIETNDEEVYFSTNGFNLAKYKKINDIYEVIVYTYTFEQDDFKLDLDDEGVDIFGRKAITTGFNTFDKRIKMFKGEFVVIASRPMMGKTSFISQLCNNQIELGLSVGVYSLEQSKENFFIKILAQKTSIPIINLVNNNLNYKQMEKLKNTFPEIKNSFLIDTTNYNLKALITKIKRDCIRRKHSYS